ncbi:MAG: hypothetical protein RR313_00030 [Anaerovoracaceae bacterium]
MEDDTFYLISAKTPKLALTSQLFEQYITTNASFLEYFDGIADLEDFFADNVPTCFSRFLMEIQEVSVIVQNTKESNCIEGITRIVQEGKRKAKIAYTGIKEEKIYVEAEGRYLRGFQVLLTDLCLIQTLNYIPLDKSIGGGNIRILQWNKRKLIKEGPSKVHNQIESILYVVDKEFTSMSDVLADIEQPSDIDLGKLLSMVLWGEESI